MNRRERLTKTLRGESVDRPPVCFYELNGLDENPADPDPYNIYSHPSWAPLLDLTREKTDRIVMRGVGYREICPDPLLHMATDKVREEGNRRYTTRTVAARGRTLTMRTRRDMDVNTLWTEEHLLKDEEDLKVFLELPEPQANGTIDTLPVLEAERAIGDTGIVMIDTPDPLCLAAALFDMGDYTVIAMTEQALFHRLLDRYAAQILPMVERISEALPGRLWRIYGPEYATPPFLPPSLFREYVCRHVTPMIAAIHRHGGYARVHSHGRVKDVLDDIVAMGADAIDPLEPPPQGDVQLADVRRRYGRQLVLFGNLEINDIENMPSSRFAEKVRRAIDEGTSTPGRGFVLMPSACPYGRVLSPLTLRNYETILDVMESL